MRVKRTRTCIKRHRCTCGSGPVTPGNGKNYLVIIDAYSKWLEVIPTRGCNVDVTIRELRKIFVYPITDQLLQVKNLLPL